MHTIAPYQLSYCIHWNYTPVPCPPEYDVVPVYQYYSYITPDEAPRFLLSTKDERNGWKLYESGNRYSGFYAYGATQPGVVPIYQYYAKVNGLHRYYYSTDKNDPNGKAGWTKDFVAFHAYSKPQPFTIPVYQYYFKNSNGSVNYLYSTYPKLELSGLWKGWKREKIAFYASNGQSFGYYL